ncbi:MAG: class I SAM-dependent RNA methyltransferase [Eggerthellaceae bacterium]|nr:class I SAM-dependent RNA methyltransferase [Eggerthellaceae bacterium]
MPVGRRVVAAVRDIMARYGMAPYDEDAQRGFVRHVVVRVGAQTGEVLATIVTNGHEFAGAKNFCRELLKRVPEVTTVVQNVNTRSTNAIFGTEEHVLYGPGFILDTLCGLSFRISSNSFFQVNARQTQVLYQVAVDFAFEPVDKALDAPHGAEATNAPRSPHASDTPQAVDPLHAPHSSSPADATATIVDAYCGTGTIGLVVAAAMPGAQIIGVDKTASAIADARQNAAHNGIDNAQFVAQDAGEFLSAYAAVGNTVDIVLMDPPRAGASEDFLRSLAHLAPRRIVYISCNPETQARDCKALAEAGYVLHAVQPVDMVPHTEHVECVALLSRVK